MVISSIQAGARRRGSQRARDERTVLPGERCEWCRSLSTRDEGVLWVPFPRIILGTPRRGKPRGLTDGISGSISPLLPLLYPEVSYCSSKRSI